MWDLIVSVPGHCLSFYLLCSCARTTEPSLQKSKQVSEPEGLSQKINIQSQDRRREIPAASAESLPCLYRLQTGLSPPVNFFY